MQGNEREPLFPALELRAVDAETTTPCLILQDCVRSWTVQRQTEITWLDSSLRGPLKGHVSVCMCGCVRDRASICVEEGEER